MQINSLTLEQIYRLPFVTLREIAPDRVQKIVPSTKFSKNKLDRNRYYLDIVPFSESQTDKIEQIVQRLWMPETALLRMHEELERFKTVLFFGVGLSHGKMAYRIYLGFGDKKEKTTGKSAVSIDWVPGTPDYVVKTYQELGSVSRKIQLSTLKECLLPITPHLDNEDNKAVYKQCEKVTATAGQDLFLTIIKEEDQKRNSVAFNYHKLPRTTNTDLQPDLDALAKIFKLPSETYQAWLQDTKDFKIIDFAAGKAWNEKPFVTIYHGYLTEPPPFYHNQKTKSLMPKIDRSISISLGEKVMEHSLVLPSGADAECSCSGGLATQLLYAIGTINYDFGTTARRDSLVQDGRVSADTAWNPDDPMELLDNLEQQPWEASSLIWTLNQEQTPIYAIMPSGAYASKGYELLRQFLREQLTEGVERVSIPGITGGSVRLLSGVVVPVIIPSVRGMYSWSTTALTNSILGEPPESEAEQTQSYEQRAEGITNFLDRIYYELRNLGIIPQERAVNYAATNAFQISRVFEQAASENMQLDQIEVEISPLSRPESECYDVKLVFFDPEHQNQRARKVYRFTVDVSDVVPVTVGRVRSWSIY